MRLSPTPFLVTSLALASCADLPTAPALAPVAFEAIPGWSTDREDLAFAEFRRACAALDAMPADAPLGGAGLAGEAGGHAADDRGACLAARETTIATAADARRFFTTWFAAYRAGDLALGAYFEPVVAGSPVRTAAFPVPVLGRPADLVTTRAPDGRVVSGRVAGGVVASYPARDAIDRGALDGLAPVLAWLPDRVDLFVMQKEGAGRVALPDGTTLRLAYAGQNGRPSAPIADSLRDHGLLAPDATGSAAIRAALLAYPVQAAPLIEADPNYVFFRVVPAVPAELGPPGTLGVALAPLRSLAVDPAAIPLGTPVFLDPGGLVLADDEGSDLRAPDRADLFLGAGAPAARRASPPSSRAAAYLLLPRPVAQSVGPTRN